MPDVIWAGICRMDGCGMELTVERETPMGGVDFDGTDRTHDNPFPFRVVRCPAGHWYTQEAARAD